MSIRNNEFYKRAADSIMISEYDDKASNRPFTAFTFYDGELAVLKFDKDQTLIDINVTTTINTDLITDEDWVELHTNKSVGEIIEKFNERRSKLTFAQVVGDSQPIECLHDAYTSVFGEGHPVSLRLFIKRLNDLSDNSIDSILTRPCFKSTITLQDIMFWEEN